MGRAVTIEIRVRPGASRTAVGGTYGEPPALVVAVTAPAVDGRATDAALAALAAALGVRPRQVSLRSGATSRTKLVEVADPPPDLVERLVALRGPSGRPG
jgi:uncharacterized protein (TIGR00251 family)